MDKKKNGTTRLLLIVDGSNVADIYGKKPKLKYLQLVISELQSKNIPHIVMVDATLRHRLEDEKEKQELNELIDSNKILQAPAGRRADDLIIQLSIKRQSKGENVHVVTNDTFPEKEARGVIPRITVSYVNISNDDELIFSPSLDTLIEHVKETTIKTPEIKKETGIKEKRDGEMNDLLLNAFMTFLNTLEPPTKECDLIPFATIAGYLHNQFEGNFCRKFGYRKPIEFAYVLDRNELVIIRRKGTPPSIYLEITKKTINECHKHKKTPHPQK